MHVGGCELNYADLGFTTWPLGSAASSKHVTLTIESKWPGCGWKVLRVNSHGLETPLTEIEGRSEWTGRVLGGSVIVFRRDADCPYDGAFFCALSVPTSSPGFKIKLD